MSNTNRRNISQKKTTDKHSGYKHSGYKHSGNKHSGYKHKNYTHKRRNNAFKTRRNRRYRHYGGIGTSPLNPSYTHLKNQTKKKSLQKILEIPLLKNVLINETFKKKEEEKRNKKMEKQKIFALIKKTSEELEKLKFDNDPL